MEVRTDQGLRQNVPAAIAVCWTIEAYVGKVCEGRGLKRFLHLHAVAQPTSRRDDGHVKERIQYIPHISVQLSAVHVCGPLLNTGGIQTDNTVRTK